jgi:CheY-like chemotaxis protein
LQFHSGLPGCWRVDASSIAKAAPRAVDAGQPGWRDKSAAALHIAHFRGLRYLYTGTRQRRNLGDGTGLDREQDLQRQTCMTRRAVLIVEDEPLIREALAASLASRYDVHRAAGAAAAMRILGDKFVDVVFADVQIEGDIDGFELAQWIEINYPGVIVIMTSGVAADRHFGAGPLIEKPYEFDYVAQRIAGALEQYGKA